MILVPDDHVESGAIYVQLQDVHYGTIIISQILASGLRGEIPHIELRLPVGEYEAEDFTQIYGIFKRLHVQANCQRAVLHAFYVTPFTSRLEQPRSPKIDSF